MEDRKVIHIKSSAHVQLYCKTVTMFQLIKPGGRCRTCAAFFSCAVMMVKKGEIIVEYTLLNIGHHNLWQLTILRKQSFSQYRVPLLILWFSFQFHSTYQMFVNTIGYEVVFSATKITDFCSVCTFINSWVFTCFSDVAYYKGDYNEKHELSSCIYILSMNLKSMGIIFLHMLHVNFKISRMRWETWDDNHNHDHQSFHVGLGIDS